jgi:transcriptional regulator with XRE-family HTH domain
VELARQVAAARTALGLSQPALAELAGVDVRTIQNLESGKTRSRPPQKRALVETALGWRIGSIVRILDGEAPLPQNMDRPDSLAAAEKMMLRAFIGWAEASGETKRRLLAQINAVPDRR